MCHKIFSICAYLNQLTGFQSWKTHETSYVSQGDLNTCEKILCKRIRQVIQFMFDFKLFYFCYFLFVSWFITINNRRELTQLVQLTEGHAPEEGGGEGPCISMCRMLIMQFLVTEGRTYIQRLYLNNSLTNSVNV